MPRGSDGWTGARACDRHREQVELHDVRHDGGPPATSIHAYSPAPWRMGHYALGERGLGRVSVSYMEELAA